MIGKIRNSSGTVEEGIKEKWEEEGKDREDHVDRKLIKLTMYIEWKIADVMGKVDY